jgi:hypothetical protein
VVLEGGDGGLGQSGDGVGADQAVVVGEPQHGQGALQVVGDQRPVAGLGVEALGGKGGELVVVVGPVTDGLGDDGRVRGDAADALGGQAGQPARAP